MRVPFLWPHPPKHRPRKYRLASSTTNRYMEPVGSPLDTDLPRFIRAVIWGPSTALSAALRAAESLGARVEHEPMRCHGRAHATTAVIESRMAGALWSRMDEMGANCENARSKVPVLALLRQAILTAAAAAPGSSADAIAARATAEFSRAYRIDERRLLAPMKTVFDGLAEAGRLVRCRKGWDCNATTDPGPHRRGRADRTSGM